MFREAFIHLLSFDLLELSDRLKASNAKLQHDDLVALNDWYKKLSEVPLEYSSSEIISEKESPRKERQVEGIEDYPDFATFIYNDDDADRFFD